MALLRRTQVCLATLAVVVTMSACGSTVAVPQALSTPGALSPADQGMSLGTADADQVPDGAAAPGTNVPGTTVPQASQPVGAVGPRGTAEGATGTAGNGGGAAAPGSGTGTAGPTDQGTTAGADPAKPADPAGTLPPIQIGTYHLKGGSEALAAQGIGLDIPNNKPLFEAMVKYLNNHGGLAGRQIQPVYYEYSTGGDPQAQDAAACAQFTEDNHVYLVMGGVNSGAGQLDECLIKHGVPLIGANNGGDARYFAKNQRYIYEPGQANFTTGLSTLVADLAKTGFFTEDSRVGLVQYEGPEFERAVDEGLVPALARLGLTLEERERVTCCDNSTLASASANAQLKFRSSDIDRVIFMAPGGAVANYFMQSASSQGYRPQYGIWSADSPYVLALVAPKDQLLASRGIGYQPGLDVASGQDPTATTPAAQACLEFWDRRGHSNRSGLNNAMKRAMCDGFNTLLLAIDGNPEATMSPEVLEAGYNAIGDGYAPAGTFAMRFQPGGHDAANGYRRLTYGAQCSCFRYEGKTRTLR